MSASRGLFLDRDGTLMIDRGYLSDPGGVELIEGAAPSLRRLALEGWKLVLISNQSGVGRKLISLTQMIAVQNRFLEAMREQGVAFQACYLCTHSPEEGCECRKPSTHFMRQAAAEHDIDLSRSWMIGDRPSDIDCGKRGGCSTIWLRNGEFDSPADAPDFIASTWLEIYAILSGNNRRGSRGAP